ncbi:hypothetical protein [Neisseria sp. CCUG12390]|uniref:hypothetical protein n=1 Tax=Neisseria sp. CCUG12390 TaxID=3392035 RepID=UPI003A0FEDC2
MLYQTSSHDLFCDAFFICNNRLMFASLHGRDAGVLSFMAALTAPPEQGGLTKLGFRQHGSDRLYPELSTAAVLYGLSKRMTKYMTHNFGMLTHVFLYSNEIVEPNRDTKTAWVLQTDCAADLDKAVWNCIDQLSDVPLLPHWQHRIAALLEEQGCIRRFFPSLSTDASVVGVQAAQVVIPEDFGELITGLLRNGSLRA